MNIQQPGNLLLTLLFFSVFVWLRFCICICLIKICCKEQKYFIPLLRIFYLLRWASVWYFDLVGLLYLLQIRLCQPKIIMSHSSKTYFYQIHVCIFSEFIYIHWLYLYICIYLHTPEWNFDLVGVQIRLCEIIIRVKLRPKQLPPQVLLVLKSIWICSIWRGVATISRRFEGSWEKSQFWVNWDEKSF